MRTNTMTVRTAVLYGILGGLAGCLVAPDAWAQVACGDKIGPGQTVTLTGNVGPCDDVGAAVTVDGGTLDLGGFTLSCSDTDGDNALPIGILLTGQKAQVRNGTVTGCYDGVRIEGGGKAVVSGVTASQNANDGVQIQTDKNKVTGSTTAGNGDEGIEVFGSRNKIIANTVTGNGSDGIDVGGSTRKNKILRNVATGNGGDDLEDSGGGCKANRWRKNTFGSRAADCLK